MRLHFLFVCTYVFLLVFSAINQNWPVLLFFLIVSCISFMEYFLFYGKKYYQTQLIIAAIGFLFYIYLAEGVFFLLFAIAPFLNSLPQIFNKGLMPCSPEAFIKMSKKLDETDDLGQIKNRPGYCYVNSETKLAFLGDNFYSKYLGGVVSLGDIMLVASFSYGIFHEFLKILNPAN